MPSVPGSEPSAAVEFDVSGVAERLSAPRAFLSSPPRRRPAYLLPITGLGGVAVRLVKARLHPKASAARDSSSYVLCAAWNCEEASLPRYAPYIAVNGMPTF